MSKTLSCADFAQVSGFHKLFLRYCLTALRRLPIRSVKDSSNSVGFVPGSVHFATVILSSANFAARGVQDLGAC